MLLAHTSTRGERTEQDLDGGLAEVVVRVDGLADHLAELVAERDAVAVEQVDELLEHVGVERRSDEAAVRAPLVTYV